MKNNLLLLLSSFSLAALAACAPQNPRLMPAPVVYGDAAVEAKPQFISVSPKVDMIFVIDNSGSMNDEQDTLNKNADKFALGLAKNRELDVHAATVSVWDSITFKEMVKEYGQGEMRRLKDPKGSTLPDSFPRYVSSKENYDTYLNAAGIKTDKEAGWIQVLKSSMKIGIEGWRSDYKTSHKGGPNFEEVFSPVKAALSSPMKDGPNNGFRRADAHLVIVFITDTDASPHDDAGTAADLTAGELEDFLRGEISPNCKETAECASYKDQVTVLGVLAKSTDPRSELDPALWGTPESGQLDPVNIQSFIRSFNGQWMGLRGPDYGEKMAGLGTFVRSRALKQPRVKLEHAAEWETIKVQLNDEKLIQGEDWKFDAKKNSVLITRDLTTTTGALDIKVGYTPIKAGNKTESAVK